jgi:hypothetical protein
MGDRNKAGEEVKAAFDKIVQATNNPEAMQRAISEAKKKVDQLTQGAGNDEHQDRQNKDQPHQAGRG